MRKRWIIGGLIAFAVLCAAYAGYWFWLARTFEQQLALWIEQQRAMGYDIDYKAGEPTGFPFSIRIELSDVTASPTAHVGVPWRIEAASTPLRLAPWRPLVLQVGDRSLLARSQLQWTASGLRYDAAIEGLGFAIELTRDGSPPALRIDDMSITVRQADHQILSLRQLSGRIEPAAAAAPHAESSVAFNLLACCVSFQLQNPDEIVETHGWQLMGNLMGRIPQEPLPRALATWSNEGGYLSLSQLKAIWEYQTEVTVDGSIALDRQLQPIAAMTARLRNHRELIGWLESIGVLERGQALAANFALGLMTRPAADGSKDTESRIPITIQDGYVSVGAVKVAQIPWIEWQ
jgi:hypothetical protein